MANFVSHDVDRGETGGGIRLSFRAPHSQLANHTPVGVGAHPLKRETPTRSYIEYVVLLYKEETTYL